MFAILFAELTNLILKSNWILVRCLLPQNNLHQSLFLLNLLL